jgi:pilus assembly protein Flp/PilA
MDSKDGQADAESHRFAPALETSVERHTVANGAVTPLRNHFSISAPLKPVVPLRTAVRDCCPAEPGAMTMSKFLKLIKNEKGATAIEYGLIAALIAVAAIGAMSSIGNSLNNTVNNVSNHLR